jgi:hypothetical protein
MDRVIGLVVLVMVLLIAAGIGCLKVSEWHQDEARYWREVALLVSIDPALDAKYRPELEWVEANPTSLRQRLLRSWAPPPQRRAEATMKEIA